MLRCPVPSGSGWQVRPGSSVPSITTWSGPRTGLGFAFGRLGSPAGGATAAANDGVPSSQAGLAAGLLNASQQLGSAVGLAVLSAIATSRTPSLVPAGDG